MPVRSQILRSAPVRLAAGLAFLAWGVAAGGVWRAAAHDYWLEPGSPLTARGDEMVMHLWMGKWLKPEEERPLQKDWVTYFSLFGDRSERRDLLLQGKEGQIPVAKVRLESASVLAIMDRGPRLISMDADRFNKYLAEEGAEAVIAQRAQQGQTDQPGRESYTRCLKSLIQQRDPAAATPNTLYKRRVGQRLEILLENDPSRLRPEGLLTVKILFEGRPLTGTKVFACRRAAVEDQPPVVLTAATDVKGMATFKLDQPGLWLVRLVHIRPMPAAERKADNPAQWESIWAAYTFGARTAPAVVPTAAPAASPREHRPSDND